MSLRRRRDPQYLELTTTKNGTFAASITRVSGAPDCVWRFEDGEEQAGDSCSKALDGHEQKVVCKIAPKYIQTINFASQSIIGVKNLEKCHPTELRGYDNPSLVMDLSSVSGVTYLLSLWGCSLIQGNLSSVSGVTYFLSLGGCSLIQGNLSSVSGVTYLLSMVGCSLIQGNLSSVSGVTYYLDLEGCSLIQGTTIPHASSFLYCYLQDELADQARVDGIVDDLYTAKDGYSGALTINIDGNNAAPSVPQIVKIEELVSDCGWSLSYTLPS
jgi:hypothetical protein